MNNTNIHNLTHFQEAVTDADIGEGDDEEV
jgi:hypothetical protein